MAVIPQYLDNCQNEETLSSIGMVGLVRAQGGTYEEAEVMHRQTLVRIERVLVHEEVPCTPTGTNKSAGVLDGTDNDIGQARRGRGGAKAGAVDTGEGSRARASVHADKHEQHGAGDQQPRCTPSNKVLWHEHLHIHGHEHILSSPPPYTLASLQRILCFLQESMRCITLYFGSNTQPHVRVTSITYESD
ncbi:hypothetical protein PTNB85_10477 [Pyrenophora teres f. teres]|uniref:Uncharacterized protein n=1 Tax=Pyrenophora teres f. teres TaxID=97479 RepID=A0A6S6WJF5_9PLEO|nr:hypothetical protein PTNB85_10477 [Pyrenophora teres f. teres]KAE8823847.1 hypothetical protein HRS9139_09029 [Pyrenophora teres f. teres]KAE8854896.1 hypothetical protein PTNB29_09147 [Pyrenophora teres f. teres]CAE7213258.1 hypothetical protein PTTW11_10423 [Pyrenophora teres f. teres]